MSEWKEFKLEDVLEALIDYRGKTPKKVSRGIPLITAKIVKNGRIDTPTEFIAEEDYDEWMTRGMPKYGDVVMTTEAPLGEVGQLASPNVALAQRIVTLRGKKGVLNNDFLLYALQDQFVQKQLDARSSGSTVKGIKQSELRKIILRLPPFEIQKEIGEKIKNLDEKIDLNTQLNQTLEQIAQATFKSWFIDFDPVRAKIQATAQGENPITAAMQALSGKTSAELAQLKTSNPTAYQDLHQLAEAFPCEMGEVDGVEVPLGWGYSKADDLFDVAIGKTPPRKEPEWFSENNTDVQWISIKDMGNSGVYITKSSEYLTPAAVDKFNVKRIPSDTVILSFKLTVGRVAITACETTTNEAIAHFKLNKKKSHLTSEFLYLYFKEFNFDELGSTSSIATAVNSKTIKNINILVPNKDIIIGFTQLSNNIFKKIKVLSQENEALIETRNLLLPKLLNGNV